MWKEQNMNRTCQKGFSFWGLVAGPPGRGYVPRPASGLMTPGLPTLCHEIFHLHSTVTVVVAGSYE